MKSLANWLSGSEKQATDNFALGPARFADMLRMTERVTTPLAELERVGRADLERNLSALRQACMAYLPGATTQACVAKVAADKPTGGAVAGARVQLDMLHQFIVDHDLVSIPGTEQVSVAEAPPTSARTSHTLTSPGRTTKACLRFTTSPPRSGVVQGRPGRLHARQGDAAVHLGA